MREYKVSSTVNGQFFRSWQESSYEVERTETGTIPASAPYVMELDERVGPGETVAIEINSTPANVVAWTLSVSAGEVALDRERGLLRFYALDAGLPVSVTYKGAGTVVTPAKMEVVGSGGTPPPSIVVGFGQATILEFDTFVTVYNSAVLSTDLIVLSYNEAGTALSGQVFCGGITEGVSFVIQGTSAAASDTTINWMILRG